MRLGLARTEGSPEGSPQEEPTASGTQCRPGSLAWQGGQGSYTRPGARRPGSLTSPSLRSAPSQLWVTPASTLLAAHERKQPQEVSCPKWAEQVGRAPGEPPL